VCKNEELVLVSERGLELSMRSPFICSRHKTTVEKFHRQLKRASRYDDSRGESCVNKERILTNCELDCECLKCRLAACSRENYYRDLQRLYPTHSGTFAPHNNVRPDEKGNDEGDPPKCYVSGRLVSMKEFIANTQEVFKE